MAFYFPEGTLIQFSTTLGSAITVSGTTNANPAVATTSASHGLVDNDEVLFLPTNWSDINETVFKVDQLTTTTFSFLELDTSDTSFFPAGTGGGTVQKISSWVTVPQALDISTQGGDPRYTQIQLLASRNDIQVATGFNPTSVNFSLAHDPANTVIKDMLRLSRKLQKVAIKVLIGGSAPMYGYGTLSLSQMPTLARNQVNTLRGVINLGGQAVLYGS